jgi:hypothetical protein
LVSRCLSAAGVRFSVIRFPPRDWASLTVGLPGKLPGPRRGYHVPHARAATGVGGSYTPRTRWCSPGRTPITGRHPPPLPAASPYHPATTSHPHGAPYDEASTELQAIHPSGLPLACDPRMGRAPLRLSPELRTPPSLATHVRGRDRPLSTSLELCARHQPTLQSASSSRQRATSCRTRC